MAERPLRINRRGGMSVFSNGGMEDEDYIPALEEYVDALEAERDDLRAKLATARAALWLIAEAKALGPGVRFALSDARTAASEALAATEEEE